MAQPAQAPVAVVLTDISAPGYEKIMTNAPPEAFAFATSLDRTSTPARTNALALAANKPHLECLEKLSTHFKIAWDPERFFGYVTPNKIAKFTAYRATEAGKTAIEAARVALTQVQNPPPERRLEFGIPPESSLIVAYMAFKDIGNAAHYKALAANFKAHNMNADNLVASMRTVPANANALVAHLAAARLAFTKGEFNVDHQLAALKVAADNPATDKAEESDVPPEVVALKKAIFDARPKTIPVGVDEAVYTLLCIFLLTRILGEINRLSEMAGTEAYSQKAKKAKLFAVLLATQVVGTLSKGLLLTNHARSLRDLVVTHHESSNRFASLHRSLRREYREAANFDLLLIAGVLNGCLVRIEAEISFAAGRNYLDAFEALDQAYLLVPGSLRIATNAHGPAIVVLVKVIIACGYYLADHSDFSIQDDDGSEHFWSEFQVAYSMVEQYIGEARNVDGHSFAQDIYKDSGRGVIASGKNTEMFTSGVKKIALYTEFASKVEYLDWSSHPDVCALVNSASPSAVNANIALRKSINGVLTSVATKKESGAIRQREGEVDHVPEPPKLVDTSDTKTDFVCRYHPNLPRLGHNTDDCSLNPKNRKRPQKQNSTPGTVTRRAPTTPATKAGAFSPVGGSAHASDKDKKKFNGSKK